MIKAKAFTLIELMIVIIIVGILAAIAIPAYLSYTERAKSAEVYSIYSGLNVAIHEYYQAHGTYGATSGDFDQAYFNGLTSGIQGSFINSVDIVYVNPAQVDVLFAIDTDNYNL